MNHLSPTELMDMVIEATAAITGLPTADFVTSKCRARQMAFARFAGWQVIRTLVPDASLAAIGEHYAGRDHSTVLNGVLRAEYLMKTNAAFREQVSTITVTTKVLALAKPPTATVTSTEHIPCPWCHAQLESDEVSCDTIAAPAGQDEAAVTCPHCHRAFEIHSATDTYLCDGDAYTIGVFTKADRAYIKARFGLTALKAAGLAA